jgi:hypothetical protein
MVLAVALTHPFALIPPPTHTYSYGRRGVSRENAPIEGCVQLAGIADGKLEML